jgi:hypothetical protein
VRAYALNTGHFKLRVTVVHLPVSVCLGLSIVKPTHLSPLLLMQEQPIVLTLTALLLLLLPQAMTTADGGACLAAYRLLATMRQGAGRQADAIKVLDKALGFKREDQVGLSNMALGSKREDQVGLSEHVTRAQQHCI